MLMVIIRKEIFSHLLSGTFVALTLLASLLIPFSFYANSLEYNHRLAELQESLRLYEQDLHQQAEQERVSPAFQLRGFRPLPVESILVHGLGNSLPTSFSISRRGLQFQFMRGVDDSIRELFGKLDFLFIVKTFFGLVAIIVAYGAVSGEKEDGTLKAILANPLPRTTLLLGKIIGGLVVISVPFMFAYLLGLLLIAITSPSIFSQLDSFRLVLFYITSLLYIFVVYALGLLVSSLTTRSQTSLVLVLVIWIVAVFILPSASSVLVDLIKTVDTEQVIALKREAIERYYESQLNKELSRLYSHLQSTIPADELFERYSEQRFAIAAAYQAKRDEAIAKVDEEYQRSRQQRNRLSLVLARLSFASLLAMSLAELSNMGETAKQRFEQMAYRYHVTAGRKLFGAYSEDIIRVGGRVRTVFLRHEEVNVRSIPRSSGKLHLYSKLLRTSEWI